MSFKLHARLNAKCGIRFERHRKTMTRFRTKKIFETRVFFFAEVCSCVTASEVTCLFIYDCEILRVFRLHLSNRWKSGKPTITDTRILLDWAETWLNIVMPWNIQINLAFESLKLLNGIDEAQWQVKIVYSIKS